MVLYLVQNSRPIKAGHDVYEDEVIGVYSSEELAINTIKSCEKIPKYRSSNSNFFIDEILLDVGV